jgi:hypothetical protein
MEFIAVELVLVLGSVIGFAWWQLRDLDREKGKRDAQRAQQHESQGSRSDAP